MSLKFLLICGALSSILYVLMNIFIPPLFEGYQIASQVVSELSAIDAPTRSIWVPFGFLYVILFAAFGWGLIKLEKEKRALRIAGWIIIIYALFNAYWPPMHLRGNAPTLTDALHIAWAMVTLLMMLLIMAFGAAALSKAFRWYTVVTVLVFVTFGMLIGTEASGISQNLPTPHIGIWERINIAAFMLWVVVFSGVLLIRTSRKHEVTYHSQLQAVN